MTLLIVLDRIFVCRLNYCNTAEARGRSTDSSSRRPRCRPHLGVCCAHRSRNGKLLRAGWHCNSSQKLTATPLRLPGGQAVRGAHLGAVRSPAGMRDGIGVTEHAAEPVEDLALLQYNRGCRTTSLAAAKENPKRRSEESPKRTAIHW